MKKQTKKNEGHKKEREKKREAALLTQKSWNKSGVKHSKTEQRSGDYPKQKKKKKEIEDTVHLKQFHFELYFLTAFVL